jgi:tetratricopeptide (TPR) repeat protein
MNSAGKKIFLILLLLNSILYAQGIKKQFDYAVSLYEQEDYFNAVTEFKRLMFFDTLKVYEYEANYLTASSYKQGARFNDAIFYFALAKSAAREKEEAFTSGIEIVRANILRRTFRQAHNVLNDIERDVTPHKLNEVYYWRGWVYMFSDEWNKAAEMFGRIDDKHELKILSQNTDEKQYSVQKAKILSYLLPGAGQFYTGHYLSGILSLGWNVLWGFITINSFIEERIFDGFVTANLLWLRFYTGSVHNAGKFAVQENRRISNQALQFLEKTYDGEKP